MGVVSKMSIIRLFFKGFKQGIHEFGTSIGSIINSVLLTLTYFVGVGLTSVVAKAVHKHFLETEISKRKKTYWSDLNLTKKPIEEYYRRF